MDFLSEINWGEQIVLLAVLFVSISFHEFSHGWAASQMGDDTAEREGRLTLNPLSHIDLYGTIILPIALLLFSGGNFVFGWAKPVPYNPYNLRDQRRDPALVALAGPASNIFIAVVAALVFRFLPDTTASLNEFLIIVFYLNFFLALFNLIPLPPLDGSKILAAILPEAGRRVFETLERIGPIFALLILFFILDIIAPFLNMLIEGAFRFLTGV
ncbi:MAG: hypothetical protein A3J48_03025 [Candidatus Doudnabacteria bacterium RIFCSPHIGHO2_02_FULL_46_11]|uniref:Peptidase M50 domain-containing protein n=1 Tax=Candidatus Doudnabacteria bacterium RIFCSPHIGHO2_02_FULL_46_11 TaxID=1817832 RepID=A0A1F5P687_9BACT|nr:MAG: hypothetical protein A3J48_03025 [Candidatus Doudnabacteria bacterium RIFCSPHIGHO2_02_FULL_46_11]